jgi:class 3 adenylate cyclase
MSDSREPKPSPEVAAIIRRMLAAMERSDGGAVASLLSSSSLFRVIGSDVNTLHQGDTAARVVEAQMSELPDIKVSVEHLEAFEMGGVAWGISISEIALPKGRTTQLRHTLVFVLEGEIWRCIHAHASVPQDYESSFGVALTKTLEDLLDSLDVGAVTPGDPDEGLSVLMFTDIEDSTVLAHQVGDAAWKELIDDHDRSIATASEAHSGTVIKTLGDGALLKFGGTRQALRCAVALQRLFGNRPFDVRIGIHAGELFHTGGDVVGATVHKAARVAAAADGGQVVVSSIVRQLAGDRDEFSFGDPVVAELKGIDGRHELSLLLTDRANA